MTAFSVVEDAKYLLDPRLAELRCDFGLPPDLESAMRYRHMVLFFAPPASRIPS